MTELITNASYIFLAIVSTIWVARVLSVNGRVFLISAANGDEKIANAINQLLVVGFYLINVGYALFALRNGFDPDSTAEAVRQVATRLGSLYIILGVLHFCNIFVLNRFLQGHKPSECKRLNVQPNGVVDIPA